MTHPSAGSCGSSPLSRGICARRRPHRVSNWIIPALAGNTSRVYGLAAGAADHPRSRGEYCCRMISSSTRNGSSPLSRGILFSLHFSALVGRIIPALAGNTEGSSDCGWKGSDHPRSRGEYDSPSHSSTYPLGSSPLSRGILQVYRPRALRTGIIPALAGNTAAAGCSVGRGPDHPRSRGEYQTADAIKHVTTGSSPLSRGIRGRDSYDSLRTSGSAALSRGILWIGRGWDTPYRIIPALAGNT